MKAAQTKVLGLCCLTLELSGRRWPAVGGPLERLVRPRWWRMPPLAALPALKDEIAGSAAEFLSVRCTVAMSLGMNDGRG